MISKAQRRQFEKKIVDTNFLETVDGISYRVKTYSLDWL
jgi:hypothetical protein